MTKEQRNARVQARYDELMQEGKHGHYETLFRVVREEVEAARVQAINECALIAGGLYQHYRDLYKGRATPVDKEHWYNPHTDGVADGAGMAEDAIRALIGAKT